MVDNVPHTSFIHGAENMIAISGDRKGMSAVHAHLDAESDAVVRIVGGRLTVTIKPPNNSSGETLSTIISLVGFRKDLT